MDTSVNSTAQPGSRVISPVSSDTSDDEEVSDNSRGAMGGPRDARASTDAQSSSAAPSLRALSSAASTSDEEGLDGDYRVGGTRDARAGTAGTAKEDSRATNGSTESPVPSPPARPEAPRPPSPSGSISSSTSSRYFCFRSRSPTNGGNNNLPHASSAQGKEWEKWLMEMQSEISLLKRLDPDKLFKDKAEDVRVRVAAHVLQMKTHLDDFSSTGVRQLHEEITELAERAGFHFKFFSVQYMSRLGFSLGLLFISAYLCALASMCTGYRTPHVVLLDLDGHPIEGAHTLPDLGHDLWAYVLTQWLHYHTDYIDVYEIPDRVASTLASLTLCFVLVHPRRFLIMRRVAIVTAILFLFRAFTVTVTSLPDASPTCLAQFTSPTDGQYKREPMFPRVLWRAYDFLKNPTQHVTCGDMIFSGHTTVLVMSAMVFKKYCRGKLLRTKVFFRSFHISDAYCLLLRRLVYLTATVGALLIIGTRLHYTLDVAIAVYITQRTFRFYHDCIKYPRMGRKHGAYTLLRWLEAEDIIAVDTEAYRLVTSKA